MSFPGEPDRKVDSANDRHPTRPLRAHPRRRWRLAAGLAMLAAVAAVPAQPVLSNVPEPSTAEKPVDPDCLLPEEPVEPPEKRDGVCPSETSGEPTATPDPDPRADPKPPAQPPTPTGVGGAPKPGQPDSEDPARSVSGDDGRGDRVDSRRRRRAGKGRRKDARRVERPRGRRGREKHSHRRERRGAGKREDRRAKRSGPRQRELQPIPRWARSLVSQPLPDPLPAGKRLDAGFAAMLKRTAARQRVSWPLLLAVLRARGHDGSAPARAAEVRNLARELAAHGARANPRRAIRALGGAGEPAPDTSAGIGRRVTFADRVLALAGYHRAVGLEGLVRGLHAVKPRLIERVLTSDRILIYPGGRSDVEAGQIDGHVLVLMLYLAHRHRTVTVSSLKSGHAFFTKSGNVSNHSFGRAVDIAALGGVPIAGHQDAGGVTERAIQNILLLPKELWPTELISLFDMGGPSFVMADHADHIHAGFDA